MGTVGHVTPLSHAAQAALTSHSVIPALCATVALCVLAACLCAAWREMRAP